MNLPGSWQTRSALVLELGRLTDTEVVAMVTEECAGRSGRADIDRVVSAAEGVPFLVEELLASPGVPETFADSVQRRLEPLDHWTRSVLRECSDTWPALRLASVGGRDQSRQLRRSPRLLNWE